MGSAEVAEVIVEEGIMAKLWIERSAAGEEKHGSGAEKKEEDGADGGGEEALGVFLVRRGCYLLAIHWGDHIAYVDWV